MGSLEVDEELRIEKSEDCDDDGVRTGLDGMMGDDCGLERCDGEGRGRVVMPYAWDLYAAKSYAGGR
jgi:hypothetical protein